MRTLAEIVEGAKDGDKPTPEECYWAMLALDALRTFDHMALMELSWNAQKAASPFGLKLQAEESFSRTRRAFAVSPQDYLGPSHDPANPEYQRMRKAASGIFAAVQRKTGGEG